MASEYRPWGHQWRSSKALMIFTATLGLFSETFLYGFIVPILSYMVEIRLQIDPSQTQNLTTALLTVHGFVALVSAPIIAHYTDKTPNRKFPLLLSLSGCTVGTILLATTLSVPALFVGRVIQALSGSAGWIVCFATLADNVGQEHMGRVMGTAMSFVTAGVVIGPMSSGALLQALGYWPAWSAPLVLLALDFIARLLMIENRDKSSLPSCNSSSNGTDDTLSPRQDDTTGLISSANDSYESFSPSHDVKENRATTLGFYRIMFSDTRVLAGLLNTVVFAAVLSGFDATLPLHLQKVFGWDSLSVGMTFLGLQVPGMFFGPFVGWLRDRVGLRYPATLGWAILAPVLWLLGAPGYIKSEWANPETIGKAILISSITSVGLISPLIRGTGAVQLTVVIRDLQSKNQNIFGSHGGNSRIFSMTEISFNVGLMMGPLFSGSLTQAFGYYYMNCTLSVISLAVAVFSFRYLV